MSGGEHKRWYTPPCKGVLGISCEKHLLKVTVEVILMHFVNESTLVSEQ